MMLLSVRHFSRHFCKKTHSFAEWRHVPIRRFARCPRTFGAKECLYVMQTLHPGAGRESQWRIVPLADERLCRLHVMVSVTGHMAAPQLTRDTPPETGTDRRPLPETDRCIRQHVPGRSGGGGRTDRDAPRESRRRWRRGGGGGGRERLGGAPAVQWRPLAGILCDRRRRRCRKPARVRVAGRGRCAHVSRPGRRRADLSRPLILAASAGLHRRQKHRHVHMYQRQRRKGRA